MSPEKEAKPLAFYIVQWFLYFSAALFHRCAICPFFEVFLVSVVWKKVLIGRLIGRYLSELLHALRQEQRTQRVTDVLWEGRSKHKWAGIGEEMPIKHTQI